VACPRSRRREKERTCRSYANEQTDTDDGLAEKKKATRLKQIIFIIFIRFVRLFLILQRIILGLTAIPVYFGFAAGSHSQAFCIFYKTISIFGFNVLKQITQLKKSNALIASSHEERSYGGHTPVTAGDKKEKTGKAKLYCLAKSGQGQ
jgi:hypothetical protein